MDGGFTLASSDASGNCLRETALQAGQEHDHAGSVLVYGETAYLSCNMELTSAGAGAGASAGLQ